MSWFLKRVYKFRSFG